MPGITLEVSLRCYTFLKEKRLCNGSWGVVKDIIFWDGQCLSLLPLGVVVEFEDYTDPNLYLSYTKSVPIDGDDTSTP